MYNVVYRDNLMYLGEFNWNFQIFNPNTYVFRKLNISFLVLEENACIKQILYHYMFLFCLK